MVMAVLLVACFIVMALLAAAVFRHFLPLFRNPGAPSGSFGLPLVGETLGFLRPHASNTTGAFLHDHITRSHIHIRRRFFHESYGTVFKSHLFGSPTVVSCDEELNHFVLQNEERLFQCSYPGPIRGILGGSSLLVVTGERHRRIRAMALAFVASAGLKPAYLADVDRAARAVVASLRRRRAVAFCGEARQVRSRHHQLDAAPPLVHKIPPLFAFGVIVEQVLGLSPDEPVTGRILEDYSTFMKGLVSLPGLNQTAGKKFAPFGGGLRLCPGSELGKVEVAFFVHHLVLNYR
ncbi:hypothetical protein HU200_039011 [Digitaria exilis]|uniref:Cytochrome P450 n=1 Tax=Digitaria exilis TaxID=1010633 RepID=A0A835EK63_9POAL|nr:hypothetical protein HU200_039011 [Digitaria exilis]CAB3450194.1 unnamed protein product [Digitaria exilis]